MALKKDKQKVLGETFDEARIKTFLDYEAYGDQGADFHLLEKAYRGMKADNFATFVSLFIEASHDINGQNSQGDTFLQTIQSHRLSAEYTNVLMANGA